jgi:hypothetical protein
MGCNIARLNRFRPRLEILEDRTMLSTQTVLNILDSGAGSLRAAITAAKSGDTIAFAAALDGQTITLTSDQLTINKNLDIEGPGAGLLTISGNDSNRIFDVSQGLTVTIAGLTITHGLGKGNIQGKNDGAGGGGALLNGGSTVNLANDIFTDNQAPDHGGAISNGPGSDLTVVNSTFTGNRAAGQVGSAFVEGGAIWNTDNASVNKVAGVGASAVVIGCTFIGNQALGADGGSASGNNAISTCNGGAIHNDGNSTLTVEDSMFIDNAAISGNGGNGKGASIFTVDVATGGAIANDEGLRLIVDACTFSNNKALGGSDATSDSGNVGQGLGGAISTAGGTNSITNSFFDHNVAKGGSNDTGGSGVVLNGRGGGGGIVSFSFPLSVAVSNCTFTDNQAIGGAGDAGGLVVATGTGGGLDNERGATATIANSTFTGNQAVGGAGAGGQNGADGLGGGIANVLGATLTVSACTFTGNQAIGASGGTGGNGFGGGVFNDALSSIPFNAGTPATLTVTGTTITDNQATGGAAGSGGSAGQGIGGGVYFATGGLVCLDAATIDDIFANFASTSNDNIFGAFTIC